MIAHTPAPWIVQHEEHNEWRFNIVQSIDEGNVIAGPFVRRTSFAKDDIALANAAFICHAVNNHDKLREALTALQTWCSASNISPDNDDAWGKSAFDRARAALAAESEAK